MMIVGDRVGQAGAVSAAVRVAELLSCALDDRTIVTLCGRTRMAWPFGSKGRFGDWHVIRRDLGADLAAVAPGASATQVTHAQ